MSVSKGKDLALRASPYVAKVWKVYSYQRGVVHQHLSPFEVNVTQGLFANTLEKIRFKVMVSAAVLAGCGTWCEGSHHSFKVSLSGQWMVHRPTCIALVRHFELHNAPAQGVCHEPPPLNGRHPAELVCGQVHISFVQSLLCNFVVNHMHFNNFVPHTYHCHIFLAPHGNASRSEGGRPRITLRSSQIICALHRKKQQRHPAASKTTQLRLRSSATTWQRSMLCGGWSARIGSSRPA